VTSLSRWRRVIAALIAGLLGYLCRATPPDLADFAGLGQDLLAGRFATVYASAWNQAGPAQLLISRLLMIGSRDGVPSPPLTAVGNIGLVLGAMALCTRLSGDRGAALARREAVVGLVTLLWLGVPMPWNGHPAELAIPLCWAYAVTAQKRDRRWIAAAVLALATAIAPWAVLGFPCLFAAAGVRRVCGTGLLAAALGAGCYLPFVLTGHFAMFYQRWAIMPDTLPHLLAPDLLEVTWPVRALQGAVVAVGCALIARRHRDERLVIAAGPLAAVLLRVATDPGDLTYYWFPVAVPTILLLAVLPGTEPRRRRVLAVVLAYLALLTESAKWTVPGAVSCIVVLLALLHRAAPPPTSTATEPSFDRAQPGGMLTAFAEPVTGTAGLGSVRRTPFDRLRSPG
jgi:hypothetical protein